MTLESKILVGFLSFLSVAAVGYIVLLFHPTTNQRKILLSVLGITGGVLSTAIILKLHDVLWPNLHTTSKKATILSQTIHLAFVQAGMMEETFKIFFILLISIIFALDKEDWKWSKDVVLVAAFVALGFSMVENYIYISQSYNIKMWDTFIKRTLYSSNIHLLIDVCFALFLVKSNWKNEGRLAYMGIGFFLAVAQHGVVDFFLIPSSLLGYWLATALFVGIWVWVVRDMRKYVYN